MRRFLLWSLAFAGVVLGGCAVKQEKPSLVGVEYDRLFQEGWEAYARGEYALAEAKFDTILSAVTAADPIVYVSKAFTLGPQRKYSEVDAQISIALALKGGDPFRRVSRLPVRGVQVISSTPFEFQVDVGQDFLGYLEGVEFQTIADVNGWGTSVYLGSAHALDTTVVALGLEGGSFSFLLMSLESQGVVLRYPGTQGEVLETLSVPDSSQTPSVVVETLVYIPGETLIVETTYVYPTVDVNVVLDVPQAGDSLEGLFLVRDTNIEADTLSVLAYLALATAAYARGLSDPVAMARSAAFAAAAQSLMDEQGWGDFAWDPLGDGSLRAYFSYRRAQVLQAKSFLRMQLYPNAARVVNEIYGSVQIPEDTTFTPEVIRALMDLLDQVEG